MNKIYNNLMENENLLNNLEGILTQVEALNVFLVIKGVKNGAYINIYTEMEDRLDKILRDNSVFYKKIPTKMRTDRGRLIAYFISKRQNPNKMFRNNINMSSGFFDRLVGFFLGFEAVYNMSDDPCKNGYHVGIRAYERGEGGNRLRNNYAENYGNIDGIKNYSIIDFCWIESKERIRERMLKVREYYEESLQRYFPDRFFVKLFVVKGK